MCGWKLPSIQRGMRRHMRTRLLVVIVLVLGAVATDALSAPVPQTIPQALPVVKNEPPKTVKVAFVNASWHKVFRWLREETGKGVMSCTPDGTFTLVAEYTVPG